MTDKLLADGYDDFLQQVKQRIRTAQVKASLSVNRELILLYWQIGYEILTRSQKQGWGAKVVTKLAKDLKNAFPDMKGFSERNLKYMRTFAETYPDEQIVQQLVAQIPWGHNLRILDSVKETSVRLLYVQKTIENGWSRNVLVHQIESDLYNRHSILDFRFPILDCHIFQASCIISPYCHCLWMTYTQL